MTSAVPEGYRSVSPYLVTPDAEAVMTFAIKVFGATAIEPILRRPDGRLMHVALTIGDSVVMIGTPPEGDVKMPAMLHVYVADCDATYEAAVAAGAAPQMSPVLQPHGDRAAMVKDAGDCLWWIASKIEDVSPEEIVARAHGGAQ
ncbi:MAG: VOC family protein [Pseudomonadota bacterium]